MEIAYEREELTREEFGRLQTKVNRLTEELRELRRIE